MDRNITVEELSEAIQNMNSRKAPGPDGLPIEFYKTFKTKLADPLLNMFKECFQEGTLPPTMRLAMITLIQKPGKPSTECSSFRPISLMCSDTKILCKMLARRLDRHLPKLLHNNQNGFVQNRQGFHNIRRVLNILHEKAGDKDTAALSLDAQQAFDRIEWRYLFKLLPRFGFGEGFLRWIHVLYTNPVAEIFTNNVVSKPFDLQCSTRQGCPLSPMVFTLAIEPLTMAIRVHDGLAGIQIGEQEHRISLYADDVILFLTRLNDSIPNLIALIQKFGEFSGYKINFSKSSLFFLNKSERLTPTIKTPFTNAKNGFTYLGVKITPEIKTIVSSNYDSLTENITNTLNRLTVMPISMIGRINIIKMDILPKFLYLFQSIPLPLPKCFLIKLITCLLNSFGTIKKLGCD